MKHSRAWGKNNSQDLILWLLHQFESLRDSNEQSTSGTRNRPCYMPLRFFEWFVTTTKLSLSWWVNFVLYLRFGGSHSALHTEAVPLGGYLQQHCFLMCFSFTRELLSASTSTTHGHKTYFICRLIHSTRTLKAGLFWGKFHIFTFHL